uniref:Uncharacterized protein n=1 Tax=viral metagenome TaxID=1070528 RepID=A0A6C0EWE1_9ZZZZ
MSNSLTKNSELLMSFLIEKKCMKHKQQTKKTTAIIKSLYNELKQADKHITSISHNPQFYNPHITKITTISQIPKPKMFNADSFPIEIRQHINDNALYELSYTFSLIERDIRIHFIVEEANPELRIEVYNEHVRKMLIWLTIINEYASKTCSKLLTIYAYFTSLTKKLPTSNINILDENHINTAFTTTCPSNGEIVVFRKEEWFKVFMHETFHNFALDFSDMNMNECHNKILSIFPVDSKVNLYEAYTEFWAEIMNAVFCSYFLLQDKDNETEFLINCEFFINFEITYGFFQMVKTLDFMGLKYEDLYSKTLQSKTMRETLYKEHTNVLAYYVITLVLLNNYQGFLSWCDKNNLSLLQFKKTTGNLDEFCKFIGKNYKTKSMIESVNDMEKLLHRLKKQNKTKTINNIDFDYIMKNMRMSITELG